jgi:type IV secretion system protein VirD4
MFNKLFGLGDKGHNNRVRAKRENQMPERNPEQCDIKLWGIWNKFNNSSNYYHEQKAGYYPADLD